MSTRVNKHKSFLKLLQTAEENQQKALLKTANISQIRILSEIVLNLLFGNLPISTKTKSSLQQHKDKLRKLADRNSSNQSLKKLWNRFPLEVLRNIIKIALTYLNKS